VPSVVGVVRGTGRLPGRLAHWLLDPLARRPVRALRWLVAGVVAGLVLAAAAVAGAYLTLPGHIRLAWPATVMTWRTLAAAGISLALAAVAGVAIGSVRRDWRWPWPRGGERPGLVREVLLVAVTASTAWVAWQRPLPWQYGLVIAITAGLAGWRLRWPRQRAAAPLGQISGPPARYLARRIGVLRQIRDRWHQLPAGAQVTIPLLTLLNIMVTLVLANAAQLASGLWATHAALAFTAMFLLNVLFLSAGVAAPPGMDVAAPEKYSVSMGPAVGVAAAEPAAVTSRGIGLGPVPPAQAAPAPAPPTQAPETPVPSVPVPAAPTAATPAAPTGVRRAWPFRLPGTSRGSRPPRRPRTQPRLQPVIALAAAILAAGWIGYAHPGGPLLILAVLAVGAVIASTMDVSRHQAITMVLAIALGVATIDYVSWRFSVTNWQGWWLAVPLLLAEALGAMHILGFQYTIWPRPPPVIQPTADVSVYPVFILVPTLNEGSAIVRPTLAGCLAARRRYLACYPGAQVTVVVCNDGRAAGVRGWSGIDRLAADLGVRCVTRRKRGGAKAGNIENARRKLQITGDALLAIFDADQVPKPDFLLKTIPPFADTTVGWVQTGQYYANQHNPVSRWADDQQSMFYNLLCPGKAALNAAFICGTNVMIRAAALDEIGGLPQDSVTEDFAASIALHPRWRSIYLTDVLATGLGPLDIPSYLRQQGRWALGTLGVFRSNWRDILLPRRAGLRFGQRVQYLLACTHYLCGMRDFIYMLSPILFILTGVPAVRTATLTDYLWHFIPYAVLGVTAMWYSARSVTGLRGIIIGFGSFPALISSLIAVIMRRKVPFAVTAKARQGRRRLGYLAIYVFFFLLCIGCLVRVTEVRGRQETSLFISVLWVVYSLLLLTVFLWLAHADLRVNRAARQRDDSELTARQAYRSRLLGRGSGLRPVLNLGVAGAVACPLLFGTQLAALPLFASAAPPFVIAQQQAGGRYTGVSLPVQLLAQRAGLAHELHTRFSIIGRTQDITDSFDTAWADRLAASGARPWIVLQFGVFRPHRRAPLAASLPAIFHGLDDRQITRWATEIRDFGKPVYLTVLLHVDRNWAVSSGVANGGIPEDVPKAWRHIQSVFRAVGADNVAWVWAPADPLHDQPFAPPPSTISAVLQSFINYPGTRWGNPQQVLASLTRRYPGKPIFVEASVSGPPAQKAAWLARLGQAVDHSRQVYALLYHQGGPNLRLTAAGAESWSVTSDPWSLAVWRGIVAGLATVRAQS